LPQQEGHFLRICADLTSPGRWIQVEYGNATPRLVGLRHPNCVLEPRKATVLKRQATPPRHDTDGEL
jgi:hypothetical protein